MIQNIEQVLAIGQPWPPTSEVARLERYKQNEALFDGDHTKVFHVLLHLFSDHTAEYNKLVLILNWHRLLSILWADFLFGEQPRAIVSEDTESDEQRYADDFMDRNRFWVLQHARQIDVSRFGHGIIEGYYDNGCKLQVVHPSKYFPIGDENGRVIGHMIAWLNEPSTVSHISQSTLFVRIHTAGQIESRQYTVSSSGRIIGGPFNVVVQDTDIDRPLVSVVDNLITSSGTIVDDYGDLDSIIKRIETRLTRLGRIFDVHSEPIMAADEESNIFTKTVTGATIYDSSKRIIALERDAKPPQYVTWDGQVSGAFTEIEKLMAQLYAISETCEACFEPSKLGAQVSGTALRLMLFRPLRKVDRLKLVVDPAIKAELKLFTDFERVRGYEGAIPIKSVAIHWNDGLPEDFKETVANVVALKAQGLIWDEMALKMLYKLDGKALTEALAKLQQDTEPRPSEAEQIPRVQLPGA
jgi:hypothetical protein